MAETRAPRPETDGYWYLLLAIGLVLALGAAGLILWYALGGSRPDGFAVGAGNALVLPPKGRGPTGALVGGVAAGIVAQPLFVAGLIGFGIDSSGLRSSVDRLTAFIADVP